MENKTICFNLNGAILFLEQILVSFERTPIYFVCKDDNSNYYIAQYVDSDRYFVYLTTRASLLALFMQKLTMREILLLANRFWEVNTEAGEDVETDVVTEKKIEEVDEAVLPHPDSYFKMSEEHKLYLESLKDCL